MRRYWEIELRDIPEEKNDTSDVYIPNKENVINELISINGSSDGQTKKAQILKNAIQINQESLPKGQQIIKEVKTNSDRGVEVLINRIPKR